MPRQRLTSKGLYEQARNMITLQRPQTADSVTGVAAHNILSLQHADAITASLVRGDLLLVNATPELDRLIIGAAHTHLESDGTDLAYQANLTLANDDYLHLGPGPGGSVRWNSGTSLVEATVGDWLFSGNILNVGEVGGGGELLALRVDQDATTSMEIVNDNNTDLAGAGLSIKNTAGAGTAHAVGLGVTGRSWIPQGVLDLPDLAILQAGSSLANGLLIRTLAGTPLVLAVNVDTEIARLTTAEFVVNDGSADIDFRVETDNYTHTLFVQGSNDRVGINVSGPVAQLDIDQSSNTGGIPALKVDQGDVSEQCVQFSSDSADRDINLLTIDVTGTPTLAWDESGDNLNWNKNLIIDPSGTGTESDGALHVFTGSAGAVAPSLTSDLVIESGEASVAANIFCPDLSSGYVFFGTPSNAAGAFVEWDYTANDFTINANNASANLKLEANGTVELAHTEVTTEEYIRHSADLDTFWRFQTDRWTLDCGGVTMIDAVEGASDYVNIFPSGSGTLGVGIATPTETVNFHEPSSGRVYLKFSNSATGNVALTNGFDIGLASTEAVILNNRENTDMVLYTNALPRMYIKNNGRVGVPTSAPAARLHVDQLSTTAAIPVLTLDQADVSEEMINFIAAIGAGNPIDTAAIGTYYGKVRVAVNGTAKFVALYNS